MTNHNMKNIAYIPRGTCNTRNIENELLLQKKLLHDFNCITLDPSRLSHKSLISILATLDILIFPSGAAGLLCIYCQKKCRIIELSPQTVLFAEIENQDYLSRGGEHYVYICDEQFGLVGDGEPLVMALEYSRLSKFIVSLCL